MKLMKFSSSKISCTISFLFFWLFFWKGFFIIFHLLRIHHWHFGAFAWFTKWKNIIGNYLNYTFLFLRLIWILDHFLKLLNSLLLLFHILFKGFVFLISFYQKFYFTLNLFTMTFLFISLISWNKIRFLFWLVFIGSTFGRIYNFDFSRKSTLNLQYSLNINGLFSFWIFLSVFTMLIKLVILVLLLRFWSAIFVIFSFQVIQVDFLLLIIVLNSLICIHWCLFLDLCFCICIYIWCGVIP